MASHVVVFTEPCGGVVVNIRNIEAPPRCPRLIFIKSDIIMLPIIALARMRWFLKVSGKYAFVKSI